MSTSTERQARECERLAEQQPERRVQYLCEAAEYWHTEAADERARKLFERALAEQGHAAADERVAYARFLLDLGEPDRAHELLDDVWHGRELNGAAYYAAGELSEHRLDDPGAALRWYTSGIVKLAGPDAAGGRSDDVWIELLMGARHSVRRTLGEPVDEWDELWEAASRSGDDASEPAGTPAERGDGALAFLYWSPDELAEYLRLWPEGYPGYDGVTDPHVEHRREVESALREFPGRAVVARGTVSGFVDYTREQGLSPTESATRARYAEVVGQRAAAGDVVPWPPERNGLCWCGSGNKYKKCCAAPGFVTI